MKWLRIGIGVLVGLALLAMLCLGILPGPVTLVAFLLLGWISYLVRVLPQVHVSVDGVATLMVCVGGAFVLAHVLGGWLWRETRPGERWRTRWTGSLLAIVVLMFVCGIGAAGVVHQSVWLMQSDRSMFEWGRHPQAIRIKCGSNMRQIGQAIVLYAGEHGGRFPDSLEELLLTQDITSDVFICPSGDSYKAEGATPEEQAKHLKDHNDYVYHGRGLKLPLADDLPILCEPLGNHDGTGMNILFANGEVRWIPAEQAAQTMRMVGAAPASTRAGK